MKTKSWTLALLPAAASLAVAIATLSSAACEKKKGGGDSAPAPAATCTPGGAACGEEKVLNQDDNKNTETKGTGGPSTSLIGAFLKSDKAALDTVRRDTGTVLLQGPDGQVVIAGSTQSKITNEPTLFGSLFITRFQLGEQGFSKQPTQINIAAFTPTPTPTPDPAAATTTPPVATTTPAPSPTPYSASLVEPKGGRVMADGKVLLAGNLVCGTNCIKASKFDMSMAHETPSDVPNQKGFLAVFGSTNNSVNQIRFGLGSRDTKVLGAVAGSQPNTIIVAGETANGLFSDPASMPSNYISTQALPNANFFAEIDDTGNVRRLRSWPLSLDPLNSPGKSEFGQLFKIATNGKNLFSARVRDVDGKLSVVVQSYRLPEKSKEFFELAEKTVCAEGVLDANDVASIQITSLDASEKTLAVGIEIQNKQTTESTRVSCVDASEIRENGSLALKSETVYFKELLTVAGTTQVTVVKDEKVLLTRTREITDSNGSGAAVTQFVMGRPLKRDGNKSFLSQLTREKDGDSTNGVRRSVRSVVWPKGSKNEDVVWVLSNDEISGTAQPSRPDRNETLTHIGTYPAIVPDEPKK